MSQFPPPPPTLAPPTPPLTPPPPPPFRPPPAALQYANTPAPRRTGKVLATLAGILLVLAAGYGVVMLVLNLSENVGTITKALADDSNDRRSFYRDEPEKLPLVAKGLNVAIAFRPFLTYPITLGLGVFLLVVAFSAHKPGTLPLLVLLFAAATTCLPSGSAEAARRFDMVFHAYTGGTINLILIASIATALVAVFLLREPDAPPTRAAVCILGAIAAFGLLATLDFDYLYLSATLSRESHFVSTRQIGAVVTTLTLLVGVFLMLMRLPGAVVLFLIAAGVHLLAIAVATYLLQSTATPPGPITTTTVSEWQQIPMLFLAQIARTPLPLLAMTLPLFHRPIRQAVAGRE